VKDNKKKKKRISIFWKRFCCF